MAIAYWMVHAPRGPFPMLNDGEGAILFCFIFLLFIATGPGTWSVDEELLKRHDREEDHYPTTVSSRWRPNRSA